MEATSSIDHSLQSVHVQGRIRGRTGQGLEVTKLAEESKRGVKMYVMDEKKTNSADGLIARLHIVVTQSSRDNLQRLLAMIKITRASIVIYRCNGETGVEQTLINGGKDFEVLDFASRQGMMRIN